jgi:hypothetical protein
VLWGFRIKVKAAPLSTCHVNVSFGSEDAKHNALKIVLSEATYVLDHHFEFSIGIYEVARPRSDHNLVGQIRQ